MTRLLEVSGLIGGYGDTSVLFDVDASVEAGRILGVVGRNGVGKTTLARLVQGALRPASGVIRLNGADVTATPPHRRRALGVGYMPQTNMVFDDLTVRENLNLGRNRCVAEAYFDRFPRLAERMDQKAGSMSGGERKILAFVRTMIEDANCLILDEPTEGVQPENIALMATSLKERAEAGAGVLLIEQNTTLLLDVADHVIALDAGRVTMRADAADVTAETLRAALTI